MEREANVGEEGSSEHVWQQTDPTKSLTFSGRIFAVVNSFTRSFHSTNAQGSRDAKRQWVNP